MYSTFESLQTKGQSAGPHSRPSWPQSFRRGSRNQHSLKKKKKGDFNALLELIAAPNPGDADEEVRGLGWRTGISTQLAGGAEALDPRPLGRARTSIEGPAPLTRQGQVLGPRDGVGDRLAARAWKSLTPLFQSSLPSPPPHHLEDSKSSPSCSGSPLLYRFYCVLKNFLGTISRRVK